MIRAIGGGAKLTLLLVLTAAPGPSLAADRIEAIDRTSLRVCADPASLPSSNADQIGYENKIADLFAHQLGVPVAYTWFPAGLGFYRRTLQARRCDIVMGTVVGIDIAATTIPYYRSTYVLVTRAADRIGATTLDDPALGRLKLGVQSASPAAEFLAHSGQLENARSYSLTVDTNAENTARAMLDDLAAHRIDVAILWGPIGGYYAGLKPGAFVVTPLSGKSFAFDIGMALRFGEPKWRARIEQFIRDNRTPVRDILVASHVPLLPLAEARP